MSEPPAGQDELDDVISELQELLNGAIEEGNPGISAAIAAHSTVLWLGTAGVADAESKIAVDRETLFGIGSITKTFVAVVILQLVEEGRLSLSDTPQCILAAAIGSMPNGDTATVAQLLNHTAGIPSWEDDPVWIREGRGALLDVNRIWGKSDTLVYVEHRTPIASAGEKFSYANTNYTLLGMIIEKVSGGTAVSEIRKRILQPLGLRDIYVEGFEPMPRDRVSRRYHWATPGFRNTAGINAAFPTVGPRLIDVSSSNLSVEWMAGGMVATARDLALYGAALRSGRLLKTTSMKVMTRWISVTNDLQVGHNLFRTKYPNGRVIIGHNGGVLGFSASLFWIEGGEAVVSVLSNVGSAHAGEGPDVPTFVARKQKFVESVARLDTHFSRSK